MNFGKNRDPRLLGADIVLHSEHLRHELGPNLALAREMPKRSVLAMSTFYKPEKDGNWSEVVKNRAEIALKSIEEAARLGYHVICVDEFSDEGWRKEAIDKGANLHNADFEKYSLGTSPMGRCRRQAIDLASQVEGRSVGIYTEPEKRFAILAPNGKLMPLAMASTPIEEGLVDWVIPRRSDNGESYPVVQQFMERAGNAAAQAVLLKYAERLEMPEEKVLHFAQYLDHFFGPKLFRIDGGNAKYFLEYGELAQADPRFNDQWGSVHYPPIMALLDGKRVGGVPIPYVHPSAQRDIEGRDIALDLKRYEQGAKLTQTLVWLVSRDLKNRGLEPLTAEPA